MNPRDELRSKIPYSIQFALWGLGKWFAGLTKEKKMDVANSALKYVLSLQFLAGYRTAIAGVGAIGLGIYLFTQGEATQGAAAVMAGLGALGLGGKLDESTAATNANTLVVAAATPDVSTVKPVDAANIVANLPGPVPASAPPVAKK